jgi:hypothetical protein
MMRDGSDLPVLQQAIYHALLQSSESPDFAAFVVMDRIRRDREFRERVWDDPNGIGDVIRDYIDGLTARICRAIGDGRLNHPPPAVDKTD